MFRKFMIAAAIVLGSTATQAATIDAVEIDTSVATFFGRGTVSTDGAGGFIGNGFGAIGAQSFESFSASNVTGANLSGTPTFIPPIPLPGAPPPPPPPPLPLITLSGEFEDSRAGAGFIEALYRAASGSLSPTYDLFLVRFDVLGLQANPFESVLTNFSSNVTLNAVTEISAVPLPATLPMILTGLGGFAWLGRRRRKLS